MNHLNWMSRRSFMKFTSPADFMTSIIPTSGFYFEFIPNFVDCSRLVLILTTVLVALTIYLYNIRKNYKNYEKAIAEVLETGYFSNFFEKVARKLKQKLESKQDMSFTFLRSRPNVPVNIPSHHIEIKLILPRSYDELQQAVTRIDQVSERAALDTGDWVNAVYDVAGNKVVIYECPRTLLSLSKYLLTDDESYTQRQSEVLHQYFNKKFETDWKRNFENIPATIISKLNSFPEPVPGKTAQSAS